MLLNQKEIKNSRKKLAKISQKIEERSNFYYLGSDPTRLKIIFSFKFHEELCPTDFSQILNISMSAVSHQLRLLERANLLKKMKIGKMVCYALSNKGQEFLKILDF